MAQHPLRIPYQTVKIVHLKREGSSQYRSTTNDPSLYFRLHYDRAFLESSDCHIRMSIVVEARGDRLTSEIFMKTDLGYHPHCAVKRYYYSGELQEYIIHRRYAERLIRYDPHDAPGLLIIGEPTFSVWSAKAALATLLCDQKRRQFDPSRPAYSFQPSKRFKQSFQAGFEDAYSSYLGSSEEEIADPYSLWIKYVERSIKSRNSSLPQGLTTIKFSVVVPVYNTEPGLLRECVQSVLDQTYDNWELCIVDDHSTNSGTLQELDKISTLDARIKVKHRLENGHICIASNDGLSMATGDRICFLDHDDLLAPHALQRLATVLAEKPELKLIYTDEDFLDLEGRRINPHFKSDWNLHLLYSHNYITHLVCVETRVLRAIGGFRLGTEGAQDYDLLLRLSNVLESREIFHIPEVLYHWRICETSSSYSKDAKPYTVPNGKKALEDYFAVRGENVRVELLPHDNFYHVSWPIPARQEPMVSIIIPTRNGRALLERCIESLLTKTNYPKYEVIVVDNGSDDAATLDYLEEIDNASHVGASVRVKVLRLDEPFNFSRINNYAFMHCQGELICFLNNDTEVIHADWLEVMASHARRPEIGCVGAKLLYADNTIQHAGIVLSLGGYAAHSHKGLSNDAPGYFRRPHLLQEMSALTGACLMVRSELFRQVDGFDEMLFAVAYNDVDLCLKVRQLGFSNLYVPAAVLYHHESKSRGYEDTPEKQLRLRREQANLRLKWGSGLDQDFCYNPNLTKDREDFSLRLR